MTESLDRSRRTFLRRGATLSAVALAGASLGGCAAGENPGRHTIHTSPGLTTQQRIEQVRAATRGHNHTDYYLPTPDPAGQLWKPGMADLTQPVGEWLRWIPGNGDYGVNIAEVHLLQNHLLRDEQNHHYRAFIVDNDGRILRIRWTGTDRADNVFPITRIHPNFYRNAVVKVQFESPREENADLIARQGLEIHLETVDVERSYEHYAYQSGRVIGVQR